MPTHLERSFIGIEIGGTKLQIVVGDAQGRITQRHRLTVDPAKGGEEIRTTLARELPTVTIRTQPSAIGVGFGGPVDGRTGQICCSHQVKGWHNFPLGQWLQEQTRLPVIVENDSNCAALAEATCGAGQNHNPVFYFNSGSGVGGGLILDGRIYHGAKPGEVEFGHLRLDRDGTIVEERCSGWAVDRKIRALKTTDPTSVLCELMASGEGGEARHLPAALARGDEAAKRILNEIAGDFAFALSHAVHLFHPEVIVMGGGLSLVGEPLRAAIAEQLPRHVMEAFHPVPQVRLAKVAEDAVPVGALLLAGQKLSGWRNEALT